ncbi:MAG: hypothetical protein K8823_490 [Cenarchaeum symbiont of Oopsacas minuta]|nr:hypothetical protein [Cenarchaeum symbiont of Oopsacas minuta]
MMFGLIFLQSMDSTTIIGSTVVIAVIISAMIAAVQIRSVKKSAMQDPKIKFDVERLQEDFEDVSTDLEKFRDAIPRGTEVSIVRDDVTKLCGDFTILKDSVEDRISTIRRVTTEELNAARDEMVNMASKEIERFADEHIKSKGVTRDEFDSLKGRLEKIIGSDESAERMRALAGIFDSTQTRVINWQCQLIKLLKGGLAPDAEADLIVSSGIPIGPSKEFLKKLHDAGITSRKEISAYYVNPEWEWIYSYIDNPDWLQNRLSGSVIKEKDYQNYIKNNVHIIEDGLLLKTTEYSLDTGRLDLLCTDANGTPVGIELKYPSASKKDKRQLAGYKSDYERKTGSKISRFILIAPSIPDDLKESLKKDRLEYKEISME